MSSVTVSYMKLLVRIALVSMIAACHGPALPAIPGRGGPAWVELQSEHFTLWTDGSSSRGHRLIREMEHLRQVIHGVGFDSGRPDGRSLVIALRDSEEVGVFLPPQFTALASGGGPIHQPMIILPADAQDDTAHVITHELTHVISFNVIRNQPPWFAEGLAEFFASVNLDPNSATGDVGKPLDHIVARLRSTPPIPSAAMFACTQLACMDDMFYATAWATFAFLANTHPQELLRYALRLDELPPESQAQAWTEVFPALAPEKLDHELRKWLAYGRHMVWKFNVKLQEWPVTERPLHDADVLAARAVMRQVFVKERTEPPSELGAALAADPTHLIANLVSVWYKNSIGLDDARRVADAYPDDWRAWWLVGFAVSWEGPNAQLAWEKGCAILDKSPSAWAPPSWCTKH